MAQTVAPHEPSVPVPALASRIRRGAWFLLCRSHVAHLSRHGLTRMVTVRSRQANRSPPAGGQRPEKRTFEALGAVSRQLAGISRPQFPANCRESEATVERALDLLGRQQQEGGWGRAECRRGGGSSAGQSSGLIIRQVVGSSPTRPTEFGPCFLTNWHVFSSSVIPCHGVMRTRCEPNAGRSVPGRCSRHGGHRPIGRVRPGGPDLPCLPSQRAGTAHGQWQGGGCVSAQSSQET